MPAQLKSGLLLSKALRERTEVVIQETSAAPLPPTPGAAGEPDWGEAEA